MCSVGGGSHVDLLTEKERGSIEARRSRPASRETGRTGSPLDGGDHVEANEQGKNKRERDGINVD
jgi:hypothetical protein